MANVKRGLFRLYVVMASLVSLITVAISLGAMAQSGASGLSAIAGTTLWVLIPIWALPPVGYVTVRWIIRGFRSR